MTSVIEAIDRNYNSGNRSQKASDIFDEVGASKTTRDAYIKDTQDYLDSLNKYPVGYKRAKEGLDAYNESQGKAGKELIKSTSLMQDFGSGLANVGKTALSIAGDVGFNVLISAGLTAAGKAWDNYSNKQENAIEKGNEALSNYKQTNSTMQEATSWIKDNAERYTELSKGATSLGEQGSLTDTEFKEYNELSAQMATYLPSQIKGYNSLGSVKLRVTGITWNPCDVTEDLTLEFSNMITSRSGRTDLTELLDTENNRGSKNSISFGTGDSDSEKEYLSSMLQQLVKMGAFKTAVGNIAGSTTANLDEARINTLVSNFINASKIKVDNIEGDKGSFNEFFTKYLDSEVISTNLINGSNGDFIDL